MIFEPESTETIEFDPDKPCPRCGGAVRAERWDRGQVRIVCTLCSRGPILYHPATDIPDKIKPRGKAKSVWKQVHIGRYSYQVCEVRANSEYVSEYGAIIKKGERYITAKRSTAAKEGTTISVVKRFKLSEIDVKGKGGAARKNKKER